MGILDYMAADIYRGKQTSGLAGGALLTTIVLAFGMPGQLIGGLGKRSFCATVRTTVGRVIPLAISSCIAGTAYLFCPYFTSVWFCGCLLRNGFMMTDIEKPIVLGFSTRRWRQNTSAIYGWSNMWGNLGGRL